MLSEVGLTKRARAVWSHLHMGYKAESNKQIKRTKRTHRHTPNSAVVTRGEGLAGG